MSLVKLERRGTIGVVTLDRPEALNAISSSMADQLAGAFREVGGDPSIWVMVLSAAGEKAFSVGADLKERATFSLEDFHDNRRQIKGMFQALRQIPQPTVAAVFGYALGGGFELALSCDLIVADEDSEMGLPETRVGLLPAGGGTQLLTRRVGPGRAKDLILRGKRIDAMEALRLGLVVEVATQGDVGTWALNIANDVCRSSPVAAREAKRAIDAALGVPLEEGIEIEHDSWTRVIASKDRDEGIAAFNEKRDPDWSNS